MKAPRLLVGGQWRGLVRTRPVTLRGVRNLLTKIFAQAEQGTAIDYSDLTDEKLMWRRNRLLFSEQFENTASWSRISNGVASAPVITPNYSLAPDGTMTARRLQMALNGGTTTSDICSITQSIASIGRGRVVSQGVWLKTNDGSTKVLQFRDDFASTVNKLITVTPTWQLFAEENTVTGNLDINAIRLWLRGSQGTADSADLSIWGAQLVFAPTLGAYQRITDVSTEFMASFPNHSLFQDNLGQLAVFAPEQPIGLALDMRVPRGPELVANGRFDSDTGWVKGTGWSIANGRASIDGSNTGSSLLVLNGGLAAPVVAGRYYEISFTYQVTSGRLRFNPVVGTSTALLVAGTQGWFHTIIPANVADSGLAIQAPDAGSVAWVDNVSVREVVGNHAIQTTVGDRPVLDGRVNRLQYSEQLTNVAWDKVTGVTVVDATDFGPNGVALSTLTGGTATTSRVQQSNIPAATGSTVGVSMFLKAGTSANSLFRLYNGPVSTMLAEIAISWANGVPTAGTPVGNWSVPPVLEPTTVVGVYRLVGQIAIGAQTSVAFLYYPSSGTVGDTSRAGGMQLTFGAGIPRYQRIAAATDYDAIGFPKGARFNGTNSWMSIAALNMSVSDKIAVTVSFRKDSEPSTNVDAVLCELGTLYTSPGRFVLAASVSGLSSAGFYVRGSTGTGGSQSSLLPTAPTVLTGAVDWDATAAVRQFRRNGEATAGTPATGSTSVGGTTQVGDNQTLYIGRRGGVNSPFNGVMYRMGVRSTAFDNFIAMMERWANEPLKPAYVNSLPQAAAVAPLDRVIILGASLETGAFGGAVNTQSTEIVAAQNRIQALTGKAVTIHQYAVSGQDLNGTVNTSWPKALSEQAALPGNGRTLVIIGSGGNTITGSSRPLSASVIANAKSQLLTMIDQIEAKGWDWCLFDLSWRNYSAPLNQYDRTQGSWPWITGVTRSINAARKKLWGRNWTYPDGASWGDLYALYRNNVQILADEVHPADYLLTRNYVIDNVIVPAITGVPVDQRFIRDEAYTLGLTTGAPVVRGTAIGLPSMATHQGTLHLALYAAGSNPSAADVVAGSGTGFVTKVAAARNGTTIDQVVTPAVTAPANSTNYVLAAAFVSDARQTSAVVLNNVQSGVATGGGSTPTSPVVMLLRQDKIASPRANINQLSVTEDLTTPGVKLANAVRLDGTPSGIGYTQVNGFNQVNAAGQSANLVPGYFQAGELNQSWYVDLGTANVNLTGFTAGQSYQIMFAASRDVPSTDATRTGDVTITSGTVAGQATQTLNAANPPSGTTAGNITFTVTAPANGVIGFQFKRTAGNTGFGYIGGIHITPVA